MTPKKKIDKKEYILNSEKLSEEFEYYRNILSFLGGNAPIGVLCLPKHLQNKLIKAGFTRLVDLMTNDFRKIKGIGNISQTLLTSRLDQFFSVPI
jgi:hypothetical protein